MLAQALGKLRQESLEVEVSLGCTVTPAQEKREREVTDRSSDPVAEEISHTL